MNHPFPLGLGQLSEIPAGTRTLLVASASREFRGSRTKPASSCLDSKGFCRASLLKRWPRPLFIGSKAPHFRPISGQVPRISGVSKDSWLCTDPWPWLHQATDAPRSRAETLHVKRILRRGAHVKCSAWSQRMKNRPRWDVDSGLPPPFKGMPYESVRSVLYVSLPS